MLEELPCASLADSVTRDKLDILKVSAVQPRLRCAACQARPGQVGGTYSNQMLHSKEVHESLREIGLLSGMRTAWHVGLACSSNSIVTSGETPRDSLFSSFAPYRAAGSIATLRLDASAFLTRTNNSVSVEPASMLRNLQGPPVGRPCANHVVEYIDIVQLGRYFTQRGWSGWMHYQTSAGKD